MMEKVSLRGTIYIAALCVSLAGHSVATAVESSTLEDFIADQGCAIGPSTRIWAAGAGFSNEDIDALVIRADSEADTVRTGDWIVLPPALCTIRPPNVRSQIAIDDPEVMEVTSAINAFAEWGEHGCFIGPELMDRVQETRDWDVETANREYLRFLAENLANGNLT